MFVALLLGRVRKDEGVEQRIANGLDVYRRIVPVALQRVELQHCVIDLVLDDVVVGAVFGVQFIHIHGLL